MFVNLLEESSDFMSNENVDIFAKICKIMSSCSHMIPLKEAVMSDKIDMIAITVPLDSGFASGDMSGALSVIMFFMRALDWVVDWMIFPLRTLQRRKEWSAREKEWETKCVQEGKNPDGSETKYFPATTTLRRALESFNLNVDGGKRFENSGISEFENTAISELTPPQIKEAVTYCQMADW